MDDSPNTNGQRSEPSHGNGAIAPTGRTANGRFAAGNRLTTGRPRGARNKIAQAFLRDLEREWLKSGRKALEKCAASDPVAFTKLVGNLLPREVLSSLAIDVRHGMTDELRSFADAYRMIGGQAGRLIEATVEPEQVENDESPTD